MRVIPDPAENVPVCSSVSFMDCLYEHLICAVVVISIRSCRNKKEKTSVIANNIVKHMKDKRCNLRFNEKEGIYSFTSCETFFFLHHHICKFCSRIDPYTCRDTCPVRFDLAHEFDRSDQAILSFHRRAEQEIEHDRYSSFPAPSSCIHDIFSGKIPLQPFQHPFITSVHTKVHPGTPCPVHKISKFA